MYYLLDAKIVPAENGYVLHLSIEDPFGCIYTRKYVAVDVLSLCDLLNEHLPEDAD